MRFQHLAYLRVVHKLTQRQRSPHAHRQLGILQTRHERVKHECEVGWVLEQPADGVGWEGGLKVEQGVAGACAEKGVWGFQLGEDVYG